MNLHDEAWAAQTLLRALAESEGDLDAETVESVVASETNLREAIERVLLAIAEDEAHCEALAAIQVKLAHRAHRKTARIERRRGAIMAAMEQAGVHKLELATATVSVGKGKPAVVITEESQIPAAYMRERITRSPDKKAIMIALQEQQDVPGAALSNTMPSLTVRTK